MDRIIETGGYDGAPGRLPRRRGVQRRRELPVPRRPDRDSGPGQRLHRPATSTTARSSTPTARSTTGSPSTTTCGAGTPTGSGARGRSARRTRRIRRLWPRRYRRSSFYWKLIGYDQRFDIADRIEKRNGRPPRERVVQDVEVPIETDRRVRATGSWTTCRSSRSGCARCGCATTAAGRCTRCAPHHTYVNVGFWSSVPVGPDARGHTNRLIERKVSELDGHKSLYSDAFYSPRGVRRTLRRRNLQDREEDLRPRFTSARPVCEGGATTMTTFTRRTPTQRRRRRRKLTPGRDPRDLHRR